MSIEYLVRHSNQNCTGSEIDLTLIMSLLSFTRLRNAHFYKDFLPVHGPQSGSNLAHKSIALFRVFLVIFPQTLVNIFSETLSLRKKSLSLEKKCLSLDESFGVLLQKS